MENLNSVANSTNTTFIKRLKTVLEAELSSIMVDYIANDNDNFVINGKRGTIVKGQIKQNKNSSFKCILNVGFMCVNLALFSDNKTDILLSILHNMPSAFKCEIQYPNYTIILKFENANLNIAKFEKLIKG